MGVEGVATVLPDEIEDMLGETIFVLVIVAEGADPRGEETPMFGGTEFRVAPLDSDVLGRLVWGPWLLPYNAFSPFHAAVTEGAGFCCAAIGLGANWLPE